MRMTIMIMRITQDVFWTSYIRSIYALFLRGGEGGANGNAKQVISNRTSLSCDKSEINNKKEKKHQGQNCPYYYVVLFYSTIKEAMKLQRKMIFVSTTKIGENKSKILNCYFSKQIYILAN